MEKRVNTKVYYDEYDNEISQGERVLTIIYRIVILLLIAFIIWLAWTKPCNCHCSELQEQNHLDWDSDISWGEDSKTVDQQALNDKVADGMITISMNADPYFENKTAKGTFMFENYGGNDDQAGNTRPIVIELYLKSDIVKGDKSNPLYKSGKIPVGAKIESAALNGDISKLKKGNYPCVAYFYSVNENDEYVGTAGGECTLHILN